MDESLPQTRIPHWRIACLRAVVNGLFAVLTRRQVVGLEHIPAHGGCVLVFNHVSNVDPPLFFAVIRRARLTALLAADYRERRFHRLCIEAAGGLWIRRGESDRVALKSALALLEQGWIVGIAPEGRRSPTGALIEGKRGPAFLAARSGMPVLPVGVTGTADITRSLKRLRRPTVTVRFGEPFTIPRPLGRDHKQQLQAATDTIMGRIAALLPPDYRGVYADLPRAAERPDTPHVGRGGNPMVPRGTLDIGWRDLLFGIWSCLRGGDRERARARVEAVWGSPDETLATLSVRSGFDTLLTALTLPPGSEVLISALTIHDMPRIIAHHGLVPVPVDLDMETLSLKTENLDRATTDRTRAIVVAHVFGSRMPLDDVIAFARRRGLLVVEDCAQAYVGSLYCGHPDSDVSMFSFGPIKTNTALGGGVLRVNDSSLLERMRAVQARQPVQSRWRFLRRLLKYAGIKLLAKPRLYGLFVATCRRAGKTHDEVISAALRGFAGPAFFDRIRQQPSAPLLALLDRRLRTFDPRRIERRTAIAHQAIQLMPRVDRPGARAACHTFWVFPVTSPAPDLLMKHLWRHGFDATRGASSLGVVPPPAGRPELAATCAGQVMERLLYLPVYPRLSPAELPRLARIVADFDAVDEQQGRV